LEVADQMADDETEKNDPGDGHDGFFSDRGLPKTQASGGKIDRGGAHRNKSPFSEVRSLPNVWKPRSRQRFESGQVAVEDMPSPPRESMSLLWSTIEGRDGLAALFSIGSWKTCRKSAWLGLATCEEKRSLSWLRKMKTLDARLSLSFARAHMMRMWVATDEKRVNDVGN